jgi:hypothetical protein
MRQWDMAFNALGRLALLMILGPLTAAAGPSEFVRPPAFAVASHGSTLELTLRNLSSRPLAVATRIDGGDAPSYDWLTVRLEDPDHHLRTLRFVGERKESELHVVTVPVGGATVEAIDLAPWAVQHDGEPLAPGSYQATVSWNVPAAPDRPPFVATAATTVVIPAPGARCDTTGYHAPAATTLTLLARQRPGRGAIVDVGVHNAGTAAVCVWSAIATHEQQSDWLSITDGPRTIELNDARDKSAPVSALLPPGATAWLTWDVAAWAKRPRNGGHALTKGRHALALAYDTTTASDAWIGTLTRSLAIVVR